MNPNDEAPTLAGALRNAAADLERLQPPPGLQARVLAAARPAAGRQAPRSGWWAWSGAAACAVVLLGSVLLLLRPQARDGGPTLARSSGFVPLSPPQGWSDGPAWLVAAEIPSERLAALGLPYDPANAGERVRAELLMDASGEVLAVRLLR